MSKRKGEVGQKGRQYACMDKKRLHLPALSVRLMMSPHDEKGPQEFPALALYWQTHMMAWGMWFSTASCITRCCSSGRGT
jgi:hypothetical protein